MSGVEAHGMPAVAKALAWYFLAASDPPEISRDEISGVIPIYCQAKISRYQLFFMCALGASITGDDIVMLAGGSTA
jgi:hypothetical protein